MMKFRLPNCQPDQSMHYWFKNCRNERVTTAVAVYGRCIRIIARNVPKAATAPDHALGRQNDVGIMSQQDRV